MLGKKSGAGVILFMHAFWREQGWLFKTLALGVPSTGNKEAHGALFYILSWSSTTIRDDDQVSGCVKKTGLLNVLYICSYA